MSDEIDWDPEAIKRIEKLYYEYQEAKREALYKLEPLLNKWADELEKERKRVFNLIH